MGPFNSDFIISVTSESGRFLTSSIPAQPEEPRRRQGCGSFFNNDDTESCGGPQAHTDCKID
jgi:hypothetical protein